MLPSVQFPFLFYLFIIWKAVPFWWCTLYEAVQFLTVYQANTNLGLFECDGQRGEEHRVGGQEWGTRKSWVAGKRKERKMWRGIKAFSHVSIHSVHLLFPPHLTTGEMERWSEREKQQVANIPALLKKSPCPLPTFLPPSSSSLSLPSPACRSLQFSFSDSEGWLRTLSVSAFFLLLLLFLNRRINK